MCLSGEIIVVNDGSTDESLVVAEKVALSDPRVRVLHKKKNEGIGKAFGDGVTMAVNPFVMMIPGDNENNLSDMLNFYHLTNDVDVIIPFICNNEVRKFNRRLISTVYRSIVNVTFGTTLNYTNGTVIYNKNALESVVLNSSGFFYQTELLVKLLRKGFLYAEVPQFLNVRTGGKSSATTLRSMCNLGRSFIRLVFDVYIRRVDHISTHVNEPPIGTVTRRKLLARKKSCKS